MAKERRVFINYPESLKTDQNNRETFVADDPLFEPEQADFLNGFIGDVSMLTAEDLSRTPLIREITPERQKYQLSVAATFINPDTQVRESYASYTDMTRQIEANGGDTSDPNRVFSTEFYAWTPPIDYDKHINFSRYQWIGPGTANVQGEYVTKEPSHSKTVVHEWDGVVLTAHDVEIEIGLPAPGPDGTFVEDASTVERFIYRSDGAVWQLLSLIMVPDVPTDFSLLIAPVYFYVTRTGPEFQRPLVWKYSDGAGRWLSQPVVVDLSDPEVPRVGMVWEDVRIGSERRLKVFENGTFIDLAYTPADGPPGIPGADGDYIYDTREYSDLTDPWARENWWKHGEDLSSADRAARTGEDQAVRPILEFWNGLESVAGDTKDSRNDSPVYKKYAIDPVTSEIVDASESTTIFEYQQGSGIDDPVLGFPLSFNDSGEFLFEVTLETDASVFIGYHYFKDIHTGFTHGIWFKSDEFTMQEEDALGLFSIPVGISSNADHEILTIASRSRMLRHMTSIIGEQDDFSGSISGSNSYRWTDKNPTVGATIIDAEKTHLRTLATLQSIQLDVPNAIRSMAKEYNKVLVRFTNRLNQMWDNLTLTNGDDMLNVTAAEACDAVLTAQFIGRTDDFPFFFSDMGTFIQTLIEAGIPTIIDPSPTPIFIAPSPTRIGASPCFVPESFVDVDGTTNLRGHEGSILSSFGDERDLVWLELQTRFFNVTPTRFCTETDSFSALFSEANFRLKNSYGNYVPLTAIEPVDDVVPDFDAIVGPADGLRVFSTETAVFAVFSGGAWLTRPAQVDDIFLNQDDSEYYIYNGLGTFLIDRFNRPFDFEYTTNEFRNITRRDFERFIIFREQDFSENTTFVEADPFTWNYSSAGVEGHYKGQYRRVYNSVRPHSHPWEVMGYSVEPDWWRTQYVPDSTSSDGTPRYGSAHTMWTDFVLGEVDNPSGTIQNDQFIMVGPIPVDAAGELLDPIAAGVVDIAKLDTQRLDDIWVFGDGSPQEQEFLNSTFFSFSVALSGYLMKNGEWMDTLWAETYIGVGVTGSNMIFRAPHVVHSETLTRPDIEILPVHLEIENGSVVQRIGVNAWISEFVNINGGSPTTDFGRIVRNTSPALSWKTGGYIVEDRTIISTLSRAEIPFTDVHVLLHKSQPIDSTFSSGILVVREDPVGYRIFGFDPFDPFFTIERPTIPIAGGQVLLEQDFEVEFIDSDEFNVTGGSVFPNKTLQRTFVVTEFTLPSQTTGADTASLAVLVNGQKFRQQHITVNHDTNSITIEDIVELEPGDRIAVQVLTIQSSSTTQIRQFVVNNVNFPYFASGSGEFDRIEYGRFFESSTDVINFMIGYGRFLVREGWCFDTLSEGGETRDWLLGAKRFARWVIENESPWNPDPQIDVVDADSFFYSPIQDEVNFVSPFGQTTSVESIMNGAFGILNRQAQPIPVDETFVTRVDDKLNIKRSNLLNETTEIFGTRVNVVEAEHVVLFSNTTRFNDIVYDPVSGLAQTTLIVDTYRTLNWEGRIEANGYIIDGGTLLPNFEKQAFDFTRFYDRYRTIDDPLRREEARNLYGFVPANQGRLPVGADASKSIAKRINSDSSQYMIPIGAADRSRFDYYRGMIQAKGTRRPVYAFTRGTSIGRDNFFFHEDWAWKVGPGEFGDTRREIVQIRVGRNDFRDEVQVIQFSGPIDAFNNTIEIENFNRADLESNTRWILPPKECETVDTCNLEFPISRDTGLIDVDGLRYFAKLFDADTNLTVLEHVHYDPEVNKFETVSRCLVDFETLLDPARYNVVPARPETTLIDFTPVSGTTLSTGTDGDYFDISSTTARYRLWFNVEGLEVTDVTMPVIGGSFFDVDTVSGGGTVAGNAWLLNEAPSDDAHHVWYSVEDPEISSITFTGVTPNLFTDTGPGDFFTLGVVGGFYHVWFDIKDVNTDPAPAGSLGGIRVGLTGGETDTTVALAVSNALLAFQDGAVFIASIPEPSEEIVNVVNVVAGAVDDVSFSAPPTTPAGVLFAVASQGTGPNLDPGLTTNPHKVTVSASNTDDEVASATATVLASVSAFSNTIQSGSVVTVINSSSGNVTDATNVDAGVSITVVVDGSGIPNVEPPADGNTVVEVSVSSSATNQQVSDAVVAVLLAIDVEFSDATNGNGVVPTVRIRLTTVGSVTNAAIGVFPVPPILSIQSGITARDSGAFIWEEKQVGCTWWRPARKLFVDYRGLLPNHENAAKVWGLPLFFKSTLVRDDNVVTITTYDFTDIDRVTPVPHGVPVGADVIVSIRKADQPDYNAQNITVTATNTTELQYTIDTQPVTPATGDPELVLGHMDVYEWVESPVLPTEWEDFVAGLDDPTHPNGIPFNVDNPSFVEIQRLNDIGQSETFYFFWVLNSSGDNGKGNELTSQEISNRLTNPTTQGIPWFSPIDETNMIIFTDGEKVEDGYGIEVLIDERFLQSHYAFVLVTEGSQFFPVPPPVVEKMVDSLSGLDAKGNEVPSPLLAQDEKFGSCFFPIQTVFADRDAAVDVYVSALNAILKGKNLSSVDILTGIFKLADEFDETTNPTGYWQRTAFVDPTVAGEAVFDTVVTIAERDRREAEGFYAPGDIIRVTESGNTDAWTGAEVASNYQYDGTLFIEVGIDNNTAAVNANIVDPPARFRGTPDEPNGLYFFIYNVLKKVEQNSLMFSLLYEMKVQHPDPRCDWYFKTSYVSTQIITESDKSPFVRPDEATAIRNNLLDTKAFRSKFRSEAATTIISEIEPFETNILEFPDKKISLVLDRLSCNTIDDCGWDAPAWDARELPCDVWDKPLWDFADLGRDEFYVLGTFQGDSTTNMFVADAIFDPTLYDVSVVIRQNGEVVQPAGLTVDITKSHVQVFVTLNFALGPTFELDIVQSQGFYQDTDPTFIGTTLDESSFEPTPSDYKHAVARTVPEVPPTEFRTVVGGDGNTFTTTSGPFIEIYLNGVLQSQGVDYTTDFDYAAFEFSVIFTVAPTPGDDLAFVFMRGCLDINDPLGARPEERIVTEVCDSVNICVINDYTQAYLAWDTTPWDTAFWDQGPTNVGRRVFIISVGKQLEIPPGVEFFVTSEDIVVTDPTAIFGTEPQTFDIVQFELNKGSGFTVMTEGVEFEFVGTLNNLIRTKTPEREDFISDGIGTVFQTNAGTEISFVFLNGAIAVEGVNYALDITRTEITWIVPGLMVGDLISATFLPFIEVTDTVRYRFNGWTVGPLGNFTVPPFAAPLDVLTYDVNAGVFTFGSLPPAGEIFSVTYTVARPNGLPESILVRMQEIVADILPDNEAYDSPNGFNTSRAVGTRIINTTTNLIFEWDGVIWNTEPVPVAGTQYYVTRTQQIFEFNGAIFVKLFDVGDVFTNPPVLDFPPFGQGITYGTYAFGTAIPDAPIEWPDAFQVMQHPGDCPP